MDETRLSDDLLELISKNIAEYSEKLTKLEENFDITTKATLRKITESHQELEEDRDRIREKKQSLEQEIQSTKESIATYEQKIAQIEDNNSSLVKRVKEQEEELAKSRQKTETLQNRKEELLRRLQQKQDDLNNKQSSVQIQKQLAKIDLEACKKATQLDVSTVGEEEIQFQFGCINKHHPEETYTFRLFIDEKQQYSVPHCSPPVQNMASFLYQLNKDRDLFTFVKRVRKAFVDQAAA